MSLLIFLRGVSGSGKTTFAEYLSLYPNSVAISADDYFMDNGVYRFEQLKIGKAHEFCFNKTREELSAGKTVIVHNTSISNYEVHRYKDLADEYNAQFFSLIVENRNNTSNVHGVSNEKVAHQAINLLNNISVLPNINYRASIVPPRDYSKLEVLEYLKSFASLDMGLEKLDELYKINSIKLNGKVLLKYDEDADKLNVMVRECRGLIIRESDLSIVSLPFEKFGNYLEPYAHNKINFEKAIAYEKLDGTNMCLYYDEVQGKWCVQTLGQVEAERKMSTCPGMSWADLFWKVFKSYSDLKILNELKKDWTYIFELCTPLNTIVVQHTESKLYFIGIRNKVTLKEHYTIESVLFELFDKPKTTSFNNIVEVKELCERLTDQDEGFVIVEEVDGIFLKSKMKSIEYIKKHFVSTEISYRGILNVVFANEEVEFTQAYPQHKFVVDVALTEINRIANEVDKIFATIDTSLSLKEFAQHLVDIKVSPYYKSHLFNLKQGKRLNARDCIIDSKTKHSRMFAVKRFIENTDFKNMIKII